MGKSVKITQVIEKCKGKQEPILVNFEHANLNVSQDSPQNLNEVFSSAIFKRTDQSSLEATSEKTVVALQTHNLTYIGADDRYQSDSSTTKIFIGIKRKNKMTLVEATPVTLAPCIKGHSYLENREKDSQATLTKEEKRQAGVDLVKAFGSKRKRLTYERNEKFKIETEDMDASISKAASTIDETKEPQMKDESWLSLVPPCNRESKNVAGVYKINDLLTEEELDDLQSSAEYFISLPEDTLQSWKASKRFSEYFFTMCRNLRGRMDPNSLLKMKLTLYSESLITVLKTPYQQIRKKQLSLAPELPKILTQKALEEFTSVNAKGIRNRTDMDRDKLCCYVMVLVVLSNDFVLDIPLMSISLNIHIRKLLTLAKAVGVTVKYNPSLRKHSGVMVLPLPKPVERRGRMKALR